MRARVSEKSHLKPKTLPKSLPRPLLPLLIMLLLLLLLLLHVLAAIISPARAAEASAHLPNSLHDICPLLPPS